jgi:RNA polymerase sigma-70 factor (ECF subfamily)
MDAQRTTVAIQGYLDQLAEQSTNSAAEPVVRALLARAVNRLHLLCAGLLYRKYPRLTRPPLNLQSTELLSAVVERMLKAMREVRPGTVRQFFQIASQHMRWELNDVARRLDESAQAVELRDEFVAAPDDTDSRVSPSAQRVLEAVAALPDDEREVFDLIRIQGMTQTEAAELLGVSVRTVQRRLASSILILSDALADLCPPEMGANPDSGTI